MKIYLLNASNTFNYGSMMMAENFIKYFNQVCNEKHTYFVETDDMKATEDRLRNATLIEDIHACPAGSLYKNRVISKYRMLRGIFLKAGIASELAKSIDMIIVLGGDDYTEDYGWIPLVSQILKINIFFKRFKVFFIGQTMGPFYSFRRGFARYFLNKADRIYVRDRITYEYLYNSGIKNIDSIPDLALMPLTRENTEEAEKKYISFFPSELIVNYTGSRSREECLDFYVRTCTYIMEKNPSFKLLLIAHVLKPECSDDSIMVRDIYNRLPENLRLRAVGMDKSMYPYEVRGFIRQSLFTVSARMHPVVSSIECGVPSLCFSYSQKYWGVIGEGYGLKDYILDVRNTTFDILSEKFISAVDSMVLDLDGISEKMKAKNASDQKHILEKLAGLK